MPRVVAAALAAFALSTAAAAQAPPLVDAALTAMETRAEPGQRWSFVRTMTAGGDSFTAQFDPTRPEGSMWRLISPASEDDLPRMLRRFYRDLSDEDDTDLEVILGADPEESGWLREQIGEPFRLLSDDAVRAVFAFAPRSAILIESSEEEPPDFVRHLSGEVTVEKAAPLISTLRVFATSSFKPLPIARVNEMELITRYAEIEPGGPVASVSTYAHLKGSALLYGVNRTVLMENSGFERVGAPDPDASTVEER